MEELTELENAELGVFTAAIETSILQPTLYWKNARQQQLPMSLDPRVIYRGIGASLVGAMSGRSEDAAQSFLRAATKSALEYHTEEVHANERFQGALAIGSGSTVFAESDAGRRADGEATIDNNGGGGGGGVLTVRAADQMDDGSPIELQLTIDEARGLCRFDFGGTGAQVHGNWNAPSAVTTAAVIYCLRLLVGREIPLNSGCLEPVTIDIPAGSMLSPAADAAVCAGNVLTSQRVTDVILKAFGAAAASQGCMNNFTFGDAGFGYYETIAGGSGAGPSWEGTSAVQCHMTNTRMTDVEIMEKRYPVVVDTFALRRGSGGAGARGGGCGVVREVTFLRDGITASLLTERRAVAPAVRLERLLCLLWPLHRLRALGNVPQLECPIEAAACEPLA